MIILHDNELLTKYKTGVNIEHFLFIKKNIYTNSTLLLNNK
jgi:hypothetical protein